MARRDVETNPRQKTEMNSTKRLARAYLRLGRDTLPQSLRDAFDSFGVRLRRRFAACPAFSIRPHVTVRELASPKHDIFFGYYDVTPFDNGGGRLLACRRAAGSGMRAAGTPMEVGLFDLTHSKPSFVPFGMTTTWCWQQACRLQWLQALGDNLVIYNRIVDGAHGAVLQNAETSEIVSEIKAPVYAVRPNQREALAINFARLQRLRPGYGYDDLPDRTKGELAPEDDGLWTVDFQTSQCHLLLSYKGASELAPQEAMQGAVHYFNHACWNPSGTRLLLFHLWQRGEFRYSRAITMAPDGSEPHLVTNETNVSHYCWIDDDTLLLYSTHADTGEAFHLYRDLGGRAGMLDTSIMDRDGHPSLSPRGRWLLCDTLVDARRDRHLFLYDLEAGQKFELGTFYSRPRYLRDRRCDLHPRWSPDGLQVCIDASHTQRRSMMVLNVAGALRWRGDAPT